MEISALSGFSYCSFSFILFEGLKRAAEAIPIGAKCHNLLKLLSIKVGNTTCSLCGLTSKKTAFKSLILKCSHVT